MPPKVAPSEKATFSTDDKRAQYARLIVFNYLKKYAKNFGVKASDIGDVNEVDEKLLVRATDELVNGNMLDGADGIALIQELSEKGSTTGRPLTKAYAQEVRPFLRRKTLSASFGRRKGERKPREKKETPAKAPAKPKTKAGGKKQAPKKQEPKAPVEEPAPAENVEGEQEPVAA